MPQGWPDDTGRLMGADLFKLIAAGSTNATSIKASPGVVTGYFVYNAATAARFVKLYNKASAPTVGTDVPVWVISMPAGAAAHMAFPNPLSFSLGIALATVTGIADSSAAAVTANDLSISIAYI